MSDFEPPQIDQDQHSEAKLPETPLLDPNIIFNAPDITAVIQAVALRLEKGEYLSAAEVDALAIRYFVPEIRHVASEVTKAGEPPSQKPLKDLCVIALDDPEYIAGFHSDDTQLVSRTLETDWDMSVKADVLKRYPHGLGHQDDNGVETLLLDAITTSDDPDISKSIAHILDIFDKLPLDDSDFDFPCHLLIAINKSVYSKEGLVEVCKYLSGHEPEYSYRFGHVLSGESTIDEFMWNFQVNEGLAKPLIKSLLTLTDNREGQEQVLRMMVDSLGLATVINVVREYVASGTEEATHAEELGKWLLGLSKDGVPFHTELASVYKSIEFEHYQPNMEAQTQDEAKLMAELARLDKIDGAVVDLGCGTGRLSNALAQQGVPNVVGVDISAVNLAKASNESSGDVRYTEASWSQTGLPEGSAKLVYAIGRSLPHTERESGFMGVLLEVGRILTEGGVFYFDMPDPDKGAYLDARKQYLRNLEAIGIPITEVAQGREPLDLVDVVVDSPGGINYYNRYVPSFSEISRMCKQRGFNLEQIGSTRITRDDEAESVYFRASKLPNHASTQDPTVPALLQQYVDGESLFQ